VGGQKLRTAKVLMLQKKLKKKNSKKVNFLILNLIHKFINFLKKITPHPNPLPTGGDRG